MSIRHLFRRKKPLHPQAKADADHLRWLATTLDGPESEDYPHGYLVEIAERIERLYGREERK